MTFASLFALGTLAFLVLALLSLFHFRDWRWQRTLRQPFPAHWRALMQQQVPLYRRLPPPLQQRLEQRVQLFLAEKTFYGCDGFDIDDEVRLTIAGHACLLILNRPFSDYDEIRSILVYPDLFRVRHVWEQELIVHEGEDIHAGEASEYGQVILAWSECQAARMSHSPHNVILHEFAHQLDYLDGSADGTPPLPQDLARHWQPIMHRAYQALQDDLQQGRDSWLDPYGATDPAEFFAVLTEAFFQQARPLQQAQPEVYQALCAFYRFEPQALQLLTD